MPKGMACRLAVVGFVLVLLAVPAAASQKQVSVMVPGTLLTDSWSEALAAFTAKTGIDVDVVVAASWDEVMQKLPVMAAGGVAPDAVYHDSNTQGDLLNNGAMRPLDPFIERDAFDLSIWPAPVLAGYIRDGKIYGLPTGISNFTMYYNADKMYAAGLGDLPTDWDNQTEFTWDDMVAIAKKLTIDQNGDGTPEQYGIHALGSGSGARGVLTLWKLDFVNQSQTAFAATTDAHINAINEVRSLWQQHNVVGGNFLQGTGVMIQIQPYYLNTLKSAMDQGGLFTWKTAVNPMVACRCSYASFHSWGLPLGSSDPDAGWEFIKFMTADPVGAVLFSRAENRVPVLRDSIEDFVERWDAVNPGIAQVLADSLVHVWRSADEGLPRPVYNTLAAMMGRIVRGEIDALNGMREIEPVINAILDDFNQRRAQ